MYEARRVERPAGGGKGGGGAEGCDYAETDPTGRYGRFEELLGRGAMKTVYRAFDELNGMEVAWNQAKICDVLRSPEALQRLYSEVHLLSTLDHESIIRFHASWVDTEQRTFNFITEMFTSGTLREYRQRYRRVDIRAVKNWARQILHGLVYLHGHDPPVIHRDLKCDNVFVNGHLGQVKIGDLGLATVLRGSQPAHSVIGTPEFMAPELYDEEYNELVDIYSFGMCVLEMLTAEYPYSECSNPAQIYRKVTSGKLPDAYHHVQDPEARRFIGRCLVNASKRASAKELLDDPFISSSSNDADPAAAASRCGNSKVGRGSAASEGQGHRPHPPLSSHARRQHAKSTDMTITGKMNPEDDTIILKVQNTDKDGRVQNIYFPFDIVSDTPIDVANEMVKELEITDREPSQIAEVIDHEISALVPDWKDGEPNEDRRHVYTYGDEDDGNHHPFYYLSSPTSSQGSEFGGVPSHGARCHHGDAGHPVEWLRDDMFADDDDTSSQYSSYSGKYSYVNYNSGSEQETDSNVLQRRELSQPANQKSTRFCPEEISRVDHPLAGKLQKQCNLWPESPRAAAFAAAGTSRRGGGGKRPVSDHRELMRNRSLVDMRSQLLHRTLVEEVNKRQFKTVGSVENIGFQVPCGTRPGGGGAAAVASSSRGACMKQQGFTWGRG